MGSSFFAAGGGGVGLVLVFSARGEPALGGFVGLVLVFSARGELALGGFVGVDVCWGVGGSPFVVEGRAWSNCCHDLTRVFIRLARDLFDSDNCLRTVLMCFPRRVAWMEI